MTGYSFNWKKNRRIFGFGIFGFGVFLVVEHYFAYEGGMDIELIGHEILGMVSILIGFLLMVKWKQLPAFIKAVKEKNIWKILDEGERE